MKRGLRVIQKMENGKLKIDFEPIKFYGRKFRARPQAKANSGQRQLKGLISPVKG